MMSSSRTILAFAVTSCVAACAGVATPRATTTHAATSRVWHFSSSAEMGQPNVASEPPALYVHVDRVSDPARKISDRTGEQMAASIKRTLASGEMATVWPGSLPKSSELTLRGSRAFIVAATVHEVKIDTSGRRTSIACRVGIRVAPWYGVDGGEKWEGTNTATAMGSARVSTAGSVEQAVHDCVTEVATSVVTNRIVPFLHDAK